ncbi:lck-interacting transmembrane adapter 1 [Tiliqua scincoides]|uniref:lck-interacting transmembrane adapter 1 n=1 Tax=Tiliqua scincoides TaxID=71010 RepID=UPI003462A115
MSAYPEELNPIELNGTYLQHPEQRLLGGEDPCMAPGLKEGMVGGLFYAFSVTTLVAVTACLLALCTLCRRKSNQRAAAQDGVMLVEAPLLRQTELSLLGGSATNLPKISRANSKEKTQRPASIHIPFTLSEDDGTASSCSFIILHQRDLPQIPSASLLPPDQTYSNLTFLNPAQEMLYESVSMLGDKKEQPSPRAEEVALKDRGDMALGAEYASVLKVKKKRNQTGLEAGTAQETETQEQPLAGMLSTVPQVLQVEEMYSVVCKAKKKKASDSKEQSEERTSQVEMKQGNGQVIAVQQESQGIADHQSLLLPSPVIEPCYESVNCGPWVDVSRNGEQTPEPAYETVDSQWDRSRRKKKPSRNIPPENLYESIENLAFQFQNQHLRSGFDI